MTLSDILRTPSNFILKMNSTLRIDLDAFIIFHIIILCVHLYIAERQTNLTVGVAQKMQDEILKISDAT